VGALYLLLVDERAMSTVEVHEHGSVVLAKLHHCKGSTRALSAVTQTPRKVRWMQE